MFVQERPKTGGKQTSSDILGLQSEEAYLFLEGEQ